jgi:hypothetical protein
MFFQHFLGLNHECPYFMHGFLAKSETIVSQKCQKEIFAATQDSGGF